ncbi:Lnb N-terminal periplasmic domain-containing protein [Bdellovibrio svalbardensis]|uniref:DUF4105 domain-containing protein n=1 Tax=Bdellovibrio svalbardensis TaxID=2972972 RepID=A0ABT6DD92_9BACT|nr:DUF4105 domain-containing protein [Bdellovibrio svalbardensis]MDG0814793.1 DUF4105 domain-containing protein [Bdellovibrio svalbardensis]
MVLNFLFLVIIYLAPQFSWGFSPERTEAYKKQALQSQLARSSQWLSLGHYRQRLFGSYYSPIRGNFFISPQGAKDPQAELLATIDFLFSDKTDKNQGQCRYLARMSWLKKELTLAPEDILPCPERDRWKAQLGVTEAHLIFAASDLSSAASSFGHTFLKFHNPKNIGKLELLDYGVNYAAITGTEDGALYAIKGLFGSYPGAYSMQPYHQKIREYTNLEGRDLWEYKLHLNPDEVAFILDHLLELEGSYAPYYFADDNCSAQILELIEVAKPDLGLTAEFHDVVIPIDTVKVLNDKWMLDGEKVRSSLQAEWHTRYAHLNFLQRGAVKEIIKDNSLSEPAYRSLTAKEKAESLEASLSYLALTEYRDQKNKKDEKYSLSLERAKLGAITNPVQIPSPKSPLTSLDASAFYLGIGQDQSVDFYSLKWRRGFHDLLSDDSGITPFSQLDFLSFDLRYRPTRQNWDLQQIVLLNIITTYPWTEFEHPISWKIDVGTEPKLAPYFNGGIGAGVDVALPQAARWNIFAITENDHLADDVNPHLGVESLLVNKWTEHIRSLLDAKYLYSFSEQKSLGEFTLGMSYSLHKIEYRLEGELRDNQNSWQNSWKLSVIF